MNQIEFITNLLAVFTGMSLVTLLFMHGQAVFNRHTRWISFFSAAVTLSIVTFMFEAYLKVAPREEFAHLTPLLIRLIFICRSFVILVIPLLIHALLDDPELKLKNSITLIIWGAYSIIANVLPGGYLLNNNHHILFTFSLGEIVFFVSMVYALAAIILHIVKGIDSLTSIQRIFFIAAFAGIPAFVVDTFIPLPWISISHMLFIVVGLILNGMILMNKEQSMLTPVISQQFIDEYKISEGERDVILLIMKGYSNNKVCELLSVPLNEVEAYIDGIFDKTKVTSRFELTRKLSEHEKSHSNGKR